MYRFPALLAIALALSPATGHACGESMMRTGQGLRYQVYLAKVPATVLVYSNATRPELLNALKQAGHRLTVADDTGALDQALLARRYDLVMVDADDVAAVTARMQHLAVRAELMPIMAERASAQRHANAIMATAGIGQYLKRINLIVKARS